MNKKELKELKAKIKLADISQQKICDIIGIKLIWFSRMLRGDYHEPNADWISQVNGLLDDVIMLKDKHKS